MVVNYLLKSDTMKECFDIFVMQLIYEMIPVDYTLTIIGGNPVKVRPSLDRGLIAVTAFLNPL